MINFNSILETRGLDTSPTPLWKLKLTDAEYEELRAMLEYRTHLYIPTDENRFAKYARECALFYAEYWRREYSDGAHSKQMVYDALRPECYVENGEEELYQAARAGAKRLGIELYKDTRTQYLDSMLYQGGLPMKVVTDEEPNSVWDRFARGLVHRRINFDELNLGVVASNSDSLREFCEQLISALEADQYMLMPFYCKNEASHWYTFLKDMAKRERKRYFWEHPFSVGWEFDIDSVGRKMVVKYVAKGQQELSKGFVGDYTLPNPDFFSVQVRVNGKAAESFDYLNNYCRYAVRSKHPYHNGDRISIYLTDCNAELAADELDLSIPHLLYRNIKGLYELGNRLGNTPSFLMVPEGWKITSSLDGLQEESYDWNGEQYVGVHIPPTYKGDIRVECQGEHITFNSKAILCWTELKGTPLDMPTIDKMLYDVSKCKFVLCFDDDDIFAKPIVVPRVEFRDKGKTEWSETPSYGEIVARAKSKNGSFITPTNKFINIGEGFSFNVLDANESTCQVKVNWPHGGVKVEEGTRKINDVWQIEKSDTESNKIHLTFVPEENSCNQFTLEMDAPFKEFYINNIYGDPIVDDSWVPYADLDKYQYHLIGQNIKEYTYGTHRRELRWKHNVLYIYEDGLSVKSIPYEGSLLSLFPSRELIRAILEKTSRNMLQAEVPITFTTSEGKTLSFAIKDNPFRVKQEGNKVEVTGKNRESIGYKGSLKLIKMDDPQKELDLKHDEENGYVLPEEIRAWGKTLLIGRTRGRICPTLVDLSKELTPEERKENWFNTKATIAQGLQGSQLNDPIWQRIFGWFNRTQEDDIPATSILELDGVAHNAQALLCLAFVKYAQTEKENLPKLVEELKAFSADLAFSWYWLLPFLKTLFPVLSSRLGEMGLNNTLLNNIYVKWALQKGEDRMHYINAVALPDKYYQYAIECFQETTASFTEWIKLLCKDSLLEQYDDKSNGVTDEMATGIISKNCIYVETKGQDGSVDYVDVHQDYINEEASAFFDHYREKGAFGNEQWMMKRVNVVAAHLLGNANLFEQSDEIRRSIIFCRKACNRQFILALNNKIAKSKYEIR